MFSFRNIPIRLATAPHWITAASGALLYYFSLPTAAQIPASQIRPPAAALAAPANPAGIDPPLSIYESCQMLNEVQRLLGEAATATTPTLQQADRLLYTIVLYVDRVDRANPTLPYYAWQGVSSEKAPREGWDTQVFTLAAPIPQVTALCIRGRHGDIEIKYLAAVDKNRTRWEFNQTIHVPADQPRPEICFLPLPTDLAEVRVTCRRSDPKGQHWGRLFIDAGISSIPESAKQARYYLQLARGALKAGKPADARANLRLAYNQLCAYQKNRRF